ncbi:hypothetical protein ACKKBG_A24095 [Auxenochlorella protothecoides x Auxenochlorella symbiontica]
MVDPKPRRRIVPVQIAASPTIVSNQATVDDEAHVEEVCPGGADLQAQAEYAAANLGADRKLYVDLSGLEPSKPMVDWKELLKARGSSNGPDKQIAARDEQEAKSSLAASDEMSNIRQLTGLARVIARLEQKIGMGGGSSSDSDSGEPDGDAMSDEDNADGDNGTDGGGATGTDLETRRMQKNDDYDHMDEFIDDSEFIELMEDSDRRRTKFQGFFITRGEIERLDSPPAAPQEKDKKKRKATDAVVSGAVAPAPPPKPVKASKGTAADGSGGAKSAAVKPASDAGQASPRKKKRKKLAARAGAGGAAGPDAGAASQSAQVGARAASPGRAAGAVAAPAAPQTASVTVPAIVPAALPAAAAQPGPPPVHNAAGQLPGEERLKAELAELGQYLATALPPAPPPAATPEEQKEAEAVAWKLLPTALRQRVYASLRLVLRDTDLNSAMGKAWLAQVHAAFPSGRLTLAGVRRIYAQQRKRETNRAAARDKAAAAGAAAGAGPTSPLLASPSQRRGQEAGTATPQRPASGPGAAPEVGAVSGGGLTPQRSPSAEAQAWVERALARGQARVSPPPPPGRQGAGKLASALPGGSGAAVPCVLAAAAPALPAAVVAQAGQAMERIVGPGPGLANDQTPGVAENMAPPPAQQREIADGGLIPTGMPGSEGPGAPIPESVLEEAGLAPVMGDEEILSAAATQGSCDAAALSFALSSTRGSLYGRALTRVLALAGPRGASTAEAAGRGVELRLLSPSRMAPEQRSATVAGLGRASAKEHVAHVGGYRYALKAFAGVVDQPKPQKAGGAGAASKGPAPGPA